MKRVFPLLLILLLPCFCPAQSPRMGVRGKDGSLKLLQLEQADVSVRFLDGVAETVNFAHIVRHYHYSHDTINPNRIIPINPVLDWQEPHGRG